MTVMPRSLKEPVGISELELVERRGAPSHSPGTSGVQPSPSDTASRLDQQRLGVAPHASGARCRCRRGRGRARRPGSGSGRSPRASAARRAGRSGRWRDRRRSRRRFERGEREHPRADGEILEIRVHVVIVRVAAARAIEAARDPGGPQVGGVVARIALGQAARRNAPARDPPSAGGSGAPSVRSAPSSERPPRPSPCARARARARAGTRSRTGTAGRSAASASSVRRMSATTVSALWLALKRTFT